MKEIIEDIINKHKYIVGIIVFVIVILIIGGFVISQHFKDDPAVNYSVPISELTTTTDTTTDDWHVDIKGAVNQPNVYKVSNNMRVKDVIDMAGGFTQEADTKHINLSQIVFDEMLIIVPKINESAEIATIENGKVNLNTASKELLLTIDGIGEKKAEAIITFRKKQGRIKTLESLKDIKGFSANLIDKIKDFVTL